jgi:hypothetical protein
MHRQCDSLRARMPVTIYNTTDHQWCEKNSLARTTPKPCPRDLNQIQKGSTATTNNLLWQRVTIGSRPGLTKGHAVELEGVRCSVMRAPVEFIVQQKLLCVQRNGRRRWASARKWERRSAPPGVCEWATLWAERQGPTCSLLRAQPSAQRLWRAGRLQCARACIGKCPSCSRCAALAHACTGHHMCARSS